MMCQPTFRTTAWMVAAVLTAGSSFASADGPAKVNFVDHVQPIFRNHCASCHNPEEKNSDLDVMTYSSLINGGASGAVVTGGDPDASRLYKLLAHLEEPKMPPDSPMIPEAEVELVKAWIVGGLLEKEGSKAMLSSKPKAAIALTGASVDKPTGPAAMPADLLLEPELAMSRSFAATSIAASPWAPLFAVAAPKQVLLYHSETLDLLGILPFDEGLPEVLKFSRNGSLLLVGGGRGGQSGLVALFDVATGERILTVGEEYDSVLAADLSSDQQMIALGGPGKLIKIYSTKTGELIRSIKKHTDWVTALEFSPDAVLLASGDRAGGLHVWEAFSGQPFYTLNGHKGAITDVSWRADSNVLASVSEDKTCWLWEMFNGNAVKNWTADGAGVLAVDFARDGRILTAGRERTAKIWDGEGKGLLTTEAFNDLITAASFNFEGTRLAAGDWTGEIRVLKADDGARAGTLAMNPPPLADRLAAIDQQLPALVAAAEQAQTALAAANTAQQSAQAAADEAKKALVAAQAAQQEADAKLAEARKATETATGAVAAAQADADAKRADAKAKADALVAAKAALEESTAQLSAIDQSLAAQVRLVEQLTVVVAEARQAASNGMFNGPRIEQAAAVIDQALTMAKEASAATGQEQAAKKQEVAERTTQSQQAETAATAAADAVPMAEKSLADATASLQAAQANLTESEKQAAAAKQAADQLAGPAQKADETLASATTAQTQAQGAADAAGASLTKARTDRRRFEIGQVRVTRVAAQKVVHEKEQKVAELTSKAAETQAIVDAALAEVTAAETFVAQGPEKIEASKKSIADAQAAIDSANAELEMAKGVLAKKEALRGDFENQMASVKVAAEAEPENEALKGALAKATETLGLLIADRDQSAKLVDTKQLLVQQAIDAKSAAEKALVDLEQEIASMPAKIETLKAKHAEALAQHQKPQADVDAATAERNQAQAEVERIDGQIAELAAKPIG